MKTGDILFGAFTIISITGILIYTYIYEGEESFMVSLRGLLAIIWGCLFLGFMFWGSCGNY